MFRSRRIFAEQCFRKKCSGTIKLFQEKKKKNPPEKKKKNGARLRRPSLRRMQKNYVCCSCRQMGCTALGRPLRTFYRSDTNGLQWVANCKILILNMVPHVRKSTWSIIVACVRTPCVTACSRGREGDERLDRTMEPSTLGKARHCRYRILEHLSSAFNT